MITTKEITKLKEERRDLSGRLYYCSQSGEGKKMRRWIEKRCQQIDEILKDYE